MLDSIPINKIILGLWALVVCSLVGAAAVSHEKAYLESHPFFFDPVGYYYHSAQLYRKLPEAGRWGLALQEWLGNPRQPLNTALRILFFPESLRSPWGHMAVTLPFFGLFFWLAGHVVLIRTGSLAYACGAVSLIGAIPILQDPVWGLASFWLDPPAAVICAAAACCLFIYRENANKRWLVAFGLCASAATLMRYIAGAYAFVLCAPLLLACLIHNWRTHKDVNKSILTPLAIVAVTVLLGSGYYLIRHFSFNIGYYTQAGYALGNTVTDSFASHAKVIQDALRLQPQGDLHGPYIQDDGRVNPANLLPAARLMFLAAAAVMLFSSLWLFIRNKPALPAAATCLWCAFGILLFEVSVVRSVGAPHVSFYSIPCLFIAAFALATGGNVTKKILNPIGLAISTLSVTALGLTYLGTADLLSRPDKNAVDRKRLDVALGRELAGHCGGEPVWAAFYDECGAMPAMEAFVRTGRLPKFTDARSSLSIHKSYYMMHFKSLAPDEAAEAVYRNACSSVNIAVVFDEPDFINETRFDNDYTRQVALHTSSSIPRDPRWKRIFTMDTPMYGRLAGYCNSAPLEMQPHQIFIDSK